MAYSMVRECHHPNIVSVFRGIPEHICSDNGSEFTAREIRKWLAGLGVKTIFIKPGGPWENGYIESSNGKLRDEMLNREILPLRKLMYLDNNHFQCYTVSALVSIGWKEVQCE